jgi:hypothetical protein
MPQMQFRSDDTEPWPFGLGSGKDGNLNVTSATPMTNAVAALTGTAGTKTPTLDAVSTFQNADLVLIIQSRGSGAGNWELNRIASGGGSTTPTLTFDLKNNYVSGAQIVEMKEYFNVSISGAGSLSPNQAWDTVRGGIMAFFVKGTISMSAGAIN